MPPQEQDWFAQNAPAPRAQAQSTQSGGDWFSQNAPATGTSRPTESQQAASAPPLKSFVPPMDYEGAPSGGVGNSRGVTSGIPVPPQRPANETMAQGATREILGHPMAPYIGGGILTAVAGPEVGIPASMALAGLGGAATEATHQIAQHAVTPEEAPKSTGKAAGKIGMAGGKAAAAEGVAGVAGKVGGAVLRRIQSPLEEGITQLMKASSSSNPEFRTSLMTAKDDLKSIIDANPITDSQRGGIINTDFRIRHFRDALSAYKKNMYVTERAGQIEAGTQAGLQGPVTGVNPDVLQFTAKKLSKELPLDGPGRVVAEKLAADPATPLTIAEQNDLQLATSAELRKYSAGTPQQQAAARTTSKATAGYESLNNGLKKNMDTLLQSVNQPGLQSYNKRYAALSDIEEALSKRMNPSEAIQFMDKAHESLSTHGMYGRVSAALGNSPGRNLEKGLEKVSKNAGAPNAATPRPLPPPPPTAPVTGPPGGAAVSPYAPVTGPPTGQPAAGAIPPMPQPPGFSPTAPPTPGSVPWGPGGKNLWGGPVSTTGSTTPGGMIPSNPASGLVKQEFSKIGISDLVSPRQQTTLETMFRGPQWKDMDKAEKVAAVRDILNRK